jgi:hypothetical protein
MAPFPRFANSKVPCRFPLALRILQLGTLAIVSMGQIFAQAPEGFQPTSSPTNTVATAPGLAALPTQQPYATGVAPALTAAPSQDPNAAYRGANGTQFNASGGGSTQAPGGMPTPSPTGNNASPLAPGDIPGVPSVPSIERLRTGATESGELPGTKIQTKYDLPNASGQYWVEYDLRPYAQALKNVDRPQQAVLDWILKETGNDIWFNEPMGVLTADRTTLRVYHNAGMQKVVAQVYERFVNGNNEPHVFGLRLISISNPNWRSKAIPLMASIPTKTPGTQAWVMSKENAAIFFSQMRQRQDAREIQSVDLNMVQGQTQVLEQLRSRNYLREYTPNVTSPWPPLTPSYGEIQEGYRLSFSPLMSLDGKTMDVMLKCDIDQVERLNAVPIDTSTPGVTLQVEVPQFVSWRMQERFRWATDQVLVLSCGVVATPANTVENTLLTGGLPNVFGLNRVLPNLSSQRNDALLIVEFRGSSNSQLNGPMMNRPTLGPSPNTNAAALPSTSGVSRGRY